MLVMAGELDRAIAVVLRFKLPMSQALAAQLTPVRGAAGYKKSLIALAECCQAQQWYQMA